MKPTIFDEIDININPYNILKIHPKSSCETIKEAYKLIKKSSSPKKRPLIERAYNMVKNPLLRSRYNLLRNRPLDSLIDIKDYGVKPRVVTTKGWIDLILDQ